MEFFVKIQATAAPLLEATGTKCLYMFRVTSFLIDYTLKNKIWVSMLFFCYMYMSTGYYNL